MAGDPYWYDNVKLLLPMTGANNSTTIIDLERVPKTYTVGGNAKIVTTVLDPFGASTGVGYFDGSGDYVMYPYHSDFDLATIDFIIEAHINVIDWGSGSYLYEAIIGKRSGATDWDYGLWAASGGTLFFSWGDSSGVNKVISSSGISKNTWHHVAVTRNGATVRLFIDGVLKASGSVVGSIRNRSTNVFIGHTSLSFTDSYWYGYLANVRLTKNVARYTEDFTPPAAPFPNYNSQLSGTLDETLAATTFVAEAHQASDGVLSGRKVFTGSSFAVDIKTPEKAHYLTVRPDMGTNWNPATTYAVNASVFPVDPIATPYYYKRLVAGTSGSTEPAWPTTPGGKCDDGGVTDAWEMVERLVQPITHGPLIPS